MPSLEQGGSVMSGDERCGECPIATGRRRFLRDTGLAVIAALVASGLRPGFALAGAVAEIRPVRTRGALCSYVIDANDGVMIDVANEVILARSRGKVYAFSLRCPHKGTRLVWHEEESRIFCPKQKARFLAEAQHVSGRKTRDLDRYAIRREGREVVVDTDTVFREDGDNSRWQSAVITA